jgi:hypothetical protein
MQVAVNELNITLIAIWSVVAVVGLVLLGWGLRLERRKFAALDKSGQWLWVRIATLPILALSAAAVFFPASAVGGAEALAAFYLLMFTAGPLVYFALHIAMGWLVRPSLTRQESLSIAATGLAAVIFGALFVQFSHPTVFTLAMQIKEFQRSRADAKPLPHQIISSQRFSLPDAGEVWTEHWKAPPGIKITRLENQVPSGWARMDDSSLWMLCRDGQDFHVFWPAGDGVPRWRMYWEDSAGVESRSEWASVPATTTAVPFTVQWRPDGFVLPARLPRNAVMLGHVTNGKESFDNLDRLQPGETFFDNCLPLEYRRVNAAKEQPISAVNLRFWGRVAQQMVFSIQHRPAEEAAPDPRPLL